MVRISRYIYLGLVRTFDETIRQFLKLVPTVLVLTNRIRKKYFHQGYPGKKVLWFYYSSTLVLLEEIGTVKLWPNTQCIFPIQNLIIPSVTMA